MIKNIFILTLTFLTLFVYGQETTFQENDNYDARELKQIFNKKGDSLILECETIIRQVDIFNEDFMKSIVVNANTSKIDLSVLPIGEFIVQARLGHKRIIMYVFKSASIDQISQKLDVKSITAESSLPSNKNLKKDVLRYWVVYEINAHSGSNKSMSLEKEDQVAKLIAKNKLELRTEIAKYNKLTVYEVYNTSKFMRRQLRKPTYFKSSKSKVFNVTPYYSSDKKNI